MSHNNRLIGIDIFRGVAIALMIIYHFCFDLVFFGYFDTNFNELLFWRLFRYSIITLFLSLMGISLILAHAKCIHWHKVWRQVLQLSLACLAVSVVSWIQFPNSWIYFGILHFILLAYILSLWLIDKPKLTLLLVVVIFLTSILGYPNTSPLFNYLQPILSLPTYSQDLVPLLPWLAVVFLGMLFAQVSWYKIVFNASIWKGRTKIARGLSYLGKRSLVIYLIHQPILFAVFFIIN